MDSLSIQYDEPTIRHRYNDSESNELKDCEFSIIDYTTFQDDHTSLLVFEIKNADASFVNALRRIIIAEIETMAIDSVGIKENSSIISDEILAHRLGLVPMNCDPEEFTDEDKIDFDIYKECTEDGINDTLYSSDLILSNESSALYNHFKDRLKPAPIHDNIILAKLIPLQKIFLRARLKKGVGKDHAKWSPVATASYRLLPVIKVSKNISPNIAMDIQKACPQNVFDIEESSKLIAARPLACTMCRECIRPKGWSDIITLENKVNHFIFSIESVGMIDPPTIFKRACKLLYKKAQSVHNELDYIIEQEN